MTVGTRAFCPALSRVTLTLPDAAMDAAEQLRKRLERIEKAIADQRAFLHRIPDPDTRQRGEQHLFQLVEMRDELRTKMGG